MAEVCDWWNVGFVFDVPLSKRQEIDQQSSTEREKSLALGDYWVNTVPDVSWKKLAWALYESKEERPLAVTKQYLQQGMCVLSCLLWKLWSSEDCDFWDHQENCSPQTRKVW